ncbi:MAG TPA: glycerophosphodiester phosphodiesterase [Burkholderiales bacterium]|jgi:glycerophosphoryl diester phosphodiesterase|nr:glycerophosphodiester phosphodiesterase [Burkholderiales bacterium]
MNVPRPFWPYPRIIAHRGGGLLAPENTLAGLRLARNLGFQAVEFDVKLAEDGTPILMHDDTLERTTDGRGAVADCSYEELSSLDAGGWFGNEYAGEPVPSFAAAAALCREAGLWANVEIKPNPGQDRETGETVARMARMLWAGADRPPLLSSFSPLSLEAAAVEAPELPRGLLVSTVPSNWEALMRRLQCVALHASCRHLDADRIKAIHAAGYGVLAYTVNDSELAVDLLDWGVDALVTDQLDAITPNFA